jgi:hypothetical protein
MHILLKKNDTSHMIAYIEARINHKSFQIRIFG